MGRVEKRDPQTGNESGARQLVSGAKRSIIVRISCQPADRQTDRRTNWRTVGRRTVYVAASASGAASAEDREHIKSVVGRVARRAPGRVMELSSDRPNKRLQLELIEPPFGGHAKAIRS